MTYFTKKCPSCQGSGREYSDKDMKCYSCDGTGTIELDSPSKTKHEIVELRLTDYQVKKIELYKRSGEKVVIWYKNGRAKVLDPEELIEI